MVGVKYLGRIAFDRTNDDMLSIIKEKQIIIINCVRVSDNINIIQVITNHNKPPTTQI